MADPSPALQPQPQPAPRVDPHPAPSAKPKPAAAAASADPAGPATPTQVDATRTAGLLLRDAARTAEVALANEGASQKASLIEAAVRMAAAFRELAALAGLQPIAWNELGPKLSSILALSKQLGDALRGAELSKLDQEIVASAAQLEAKADAKAWAAAKASDQVAPMQGLSSDERVQLARLAIAATIKQSALARTAATKQPADPSNDHRDRDKLILLLQPALAHIATAVDAAAAIAGGPPRKVLKPDVVLLSKELAELAEDISMTPKLAWDLTFASLFDSEAQLLTLIGLKKEDRPYTGTIDPASAKDLVIKGVDPNTHGGAPGTEHGNMAYADPQSAVSGIAVDTSFIYQERIEAVRSLKSDLKEPPPPKEPSTFDVLLEFAANVISNAVSAGIGAIITDKLRGALERVARSSAERLAVQEAGKLSDAERAALIESRFKGGAFQRAAIVDSAKEGAKRLVAETSKAALERLKPQQSNAAEPLNAYTEHLDRLLREEQREAALMLAHLGRVLGQLDLDTLNGIASALRGVHASANALQYDMSLREWQNFRAGLASPSTDPGESNDPNLDAPRKNAWSERSIPGVLEIGLAVEAGFAGPMVEFKYLVLRDGEPAAIRHLKRHPRRVADTGLNRQYQLSFLSEDVDGWVAARPSAPDFPVNQGLPTFVKVGVGVHNGFQRGSLKPEELRLLKLFLSRPVTTLGLWDAYLSKRYDSIQDEVAYWFVKEIIAEAADVTTAQLED